MEFMDSWRMVQEHTSHLQTVWAHHSEDLETSQIVELDANSVSFNGESDDELYRQPLWVIVILIVGYLFVLLFGLVGNVSVLIVVGRTPRMSTVTNFFICNLAVADLLVLIFCILPNLVSNIYIPWVLGWFLCKTVPYIQGVSVCASIYSLVAISVERCVAIQWPLHAQLTKSTARLVILSIWLWSSLVAAPWAIFFELTAADEQNPDLDFCVEVWPEGYESFKSYFFLFGNFIICYLFPLGIISLCYILIWIRVWRRPLPCDSQTSSIELLHKKAKAGVLKMLVAVVMMFALSWLPLYAIFIRIHFGAQLTDAEGHIIAIGAAFAQLLSSSNSMMNPWIYAFLNVKFRRGFNTLFCQQKWRTRREPPPQYHQKPNVSIMLKRLNAHKVNRPTRNTTSVYNVTEV